MTIVAQSPSPPASHRPTLTLPAPPLTVADLDELGLGDPRLELVDGMLIVRPWPTPLRTRVTHRLSRLLAAAAPAGTAIADRVAVQINDRTELSPDIVVSREGNLPTESADGTGPGESAAATPAPTRRVVERPSLVIEVAEPANRRYDRTVKLDLYRERGVPACWLVDPDTPSIEAWELRGEVYVLAGQADGQETLRLAVPFPIDLVPADLVRPPSTDPA